MSSLARNAVCTSKAPAAIGPYSQAIYTNDLLFVSGQLGLVPDTMELAGDVEAQAHQALRNLREILSAADLTMQNVVKTTILLSDMTDFYKVNSVYEKSFKYMSKSGTSASTRWRFLSQAMGFSSLSGNEVGDPAVSHQPSISADGKFASIFFQIEGCACTKPSSDIEWVELTPYRTEQGELIECETILPSLFVPLQKPCYNGLTKKARCQILLRTLSGFDNTGNVRLWPSELMFAHFMFCASYYPSLLKVFNQNFESKPLRTVCELGAGMSGAVGLAMALRKRASPFALDYILLSDGNDRCVESLQTAAKHFTGRLLNEQNNITGYKAPIIEAKKICWPDDSTNTDVQNLDKSDQHRFDLVVAADCFFNKSYHKGFLLTVDFLLSEDPNATFVAIAPLRNGSLSNFLDLVSSTNRWQIILLQPEQFIDSKWLKHLLDDLQSTDLNSYHLDKLVGHLVILKRLPQVIRR